MNPLLIVVVVVCVVAVVGLVLWSAYWVRYAMRNTTPDQWDALEGRTPPGDAETVEISGTVEINRDPTHQHPPHHGHEGGGRRG